MLKASRLIVGVAAMLLLGWHANLSAQTTAAPDIQQRIDAIYTASEHDNAAALAQLRDLGQTLNASTPYAVRRDYLVKRILLELDSAQIDAAKGSIASLHQLAQTQRDETGLAWSLVLEASVQVQAARLEAAMVQLDEAQPLAQHAGDAALQWWYHRVRGNAQLARGQFAQALESYLQCAQLAEQTSHARVLRLSALNALSTVYSSMQNHEKSLAVIDDALVLAKDLGSQKMLGTLYLNQANQFAMLGRYKDSEAANLQALQVSRASGLARLEATVLNNLGDGYLRTRNYPKAEQLARQALDKYRELDDQGGASAAQCNVGFALMGQGRVAQGEALVRDALRKMHAAGARADEEDVLGELGRMHEQLGLYREAVATIREQQRLSQQLFRTDREKAVAALQEQFDAAQRQKQIELLARANSLKDAEISNQRLQQIVTLLGAIVTVMAGVFIYLLYRRARLANERLREANQQLEFHAVRDPLTGLFNRRSFFELMGRRVIEGGRREDDVPDGLLVLDIDHFKHINDSLGHAGGDAVLVEVARRLRGAVRDTDMVMRWGGEEFLVFSPKANAEHLQRLAQRVLKVVAEAPVAVGGSWLTVTATGGFLSLPFSGVPESQVNWEKALQIADMALYLGKVNGRNRAYGLGRLLVPFEQAMPVLERDITAAINAGMVELVEVQGPQPGVPQQPDPAPQEA
jgi:diguanylate cyclase (GGDEF)-like protein